jgi:Uma2 family endonuclease
MTAEEYWLSPYNEDGTELVRGEVVQTMRPGGLHGVIALAAGALLRAWAQQTKAGHVGVEAGFILARAPDTVRGPDVAFVRRDRIPAGGVPEGFWPFAPDLAVEIVSPGDTTNEIRAKVDDYLAAGTPLIWVVYPRAQEVVVHRVGRLPQTLGAGDELSFPELLPGFSCPVAALFF